MPEGPEVASTADFLNERFQGWLLVEIIHHTDRCLLTDLPATFGEEILLITSRGKHLIVMLSDDSSLVFKFQMEGKLHLKPANVHLHFTLLLLHPEIEELVSLYYCEVRPFGGLSWFPNAVALDNHLERAKVGPDLLRDNVTEEQWLARHEQYQHSTRAIACLLNNQAIFSGIGNYLRADILWEACVDPRMRRCQATQPQLSALYHATMKIIRESYEAGGMTSHTYLRPNGEPGNYQTRVYQRTHDPDGLPVVSSHLPGDSQTIYYVPDRQVANSSEGDC